ncbi:MAG: hypothetical protein WC569_04545, partial [Candidatus Omnitrophota bacterium]
MKKDINKRGVFLFRTFLISCMLCATSLLFYDEAHAVQIKKVQKGSVAFVTDDLAQTIDITADWGGTPVNRNKTFLILESKCNTGNDGNFCLTPYFEDNNTITILRDLPRTAVAIDAMVHVVEFEDGVTVYSGFTSMSKSTNTKTIDLPVNITDINHKAFPIVYVRGPVNTTADTEVLFCKTRIYSDAGAPYTSHIEITRLRNSQAAGITQGINIAWQVVVFEKDTNIRTGTVRLPYNANNVTFDLTADFSDVNDRYVISDLGRSLLLFDFSPGAGVNGQEQHGMVRGYINSTSQLLFQRANTSIGTTDYVDINFELIEFFDPSTRVKRENQQINASATSANITLPDSASYDITRSLPIISVASGTNTTTTSYLDDLRVEAVLTSSTNLNLTRTTSSIIAQVRWACIEFCPLTLIVPNGGESWVVGDTENITWKHAASLESGGTGYSNHHKIKIELSMNGGSTYPYLIYETPATPDAGDYDCMSDSYPWQVPPEIGDPAADTIQEDLRIKITDTNGTASYNYDTSNADFVIKGSLDIDQPPNIWKIGETKAITWSKTGNLDNLSPATVTIKLSTDGGDNFNEIITSGKPDGGDLTWDWLIPSDLASTNLIGTDNILQLHLDYNPAPTASTLVESVSTAFTLKGQVTSVTLPTVDPVNTYYLGGSYDISWQKKGHFGTGIDDGTVDILYSNNGGLSYGSTLVEDRSAGTDASGSSWNWSIASDFPKTPAGNTSRVKVVNSNDSTVYKESVDFYVVPGTITLGAPDGGQTWNVGVSNDITWTYTGNFANVTIWLSRNNGGDWTLLTTRDADLSPYPWAVTGPTSSSCLIKIASETYSDVSDVSAATFTIAGSITVMSPNGASDYWNIGDNCTVAWSTVGNYANVKIYLSTDNGVTYPTLLGEVAGTATPYTGWVVQGPPTDQAKIKVESSDYSSINDVSDAAFNIFASITLTSPDGGNTWLVGENCSVAWSTVGIAGNVMIRLSRNNGGSWTLLDEVDGDTGSPYTGWEITPPLTTEALIKVESSDYSSISDTSASNFTINGAIAVDSPAGAEIWEIGSTQDITWSTTGTFDTIDIYVSRNNGGSWAEVVLNRAVTNEPYPWTLTAPGSGQALIKIQSHDYSTISGVSGAVFTILETIHVDTPNTTGIIWRVGTSHDIEWTVSGILPSGMVDLYYKKGVAGDWILITPAEGETADDGDGTGAYPWTVPNDIHDEVYIKVQDHTRDYIKDEGDYPIKIKGSVTVSEPHLNEVVKISDTGESKSIQWDLGGNVTGTAEIRLSKNGGTSYDTLLTEGVVDITVKNYSWTVLAAHMGTDNKIKVALDGDEDLTTGTAGASGLFAVKPQIKLTYPNETGITKQVGDTMTITWNAIPNDLGGSGKVNIRYSVNGAAGPYDGTIANDVDSTLETKDWVIQDVPGMVSQYVRVKAFKNDDETNVHAESDYNFVVKGTITLTEEAKNGGVTWEAGQTKKISWTKVGDLGTVKIMYSTVEPADYTETAQTGVSSGDLEYNWPIPSDIAIERNALIKFKIASETDGNINDVSASALTIQGRLVLQQPVGNETLEVAQSGGYDIIWKTYGSVPQVKLAYDINSGNDGYDKAINGGQAITNNVTGGDNNTYNWTVPNAIGDKVRVKVMSYNYPNDIFSASTADFKIKGRVAITSPTAAVKDADAWPVNSAALPSQKLIEWTNYGSLGGVSGYVTIKHASDGVNFTSTLTAEANGANGPQSYNWTIPNTIGANNKIAVIDISHANSDLHITKESEAFEIKGKIQITSPENGDTYYIGGTDIPIEWNYAGTLGNIDLFFSSTDPIVWGDAFATIDAGYTQPYQYTVPDVPTTHGKIKVERVADRTYVNHTMSGEFRIRGSVFLGSLPNASTSWTVTGTNNKVEWTLTGAIAKIAIDLDTDSGNNGYDITITPSEGVSASSSPFTWTIPSAMYVSVTSDHCRVRVRDYTDSSVNDVSLSDFKIKPVLELTAPLGGQHWVIDDTEDITWAYWGDIPQVKIEYSLDGGSTWEDPPVHSGYDTSAGKFTWTIPDTENNDTKVRISKATDSAVESISTSWFEIMGALTLAQPNGGIDLPISISYDIKWTPTGTLSNVKIQYSKDAAHTEWLNIAGAENLAAGAKNVTQTFPWTVPNACSPTVKVKVFQISNPDYVKAVSSTDNAIIGSIVMIHPMNGDIMVVGNPYPIEWSFEGEISGFDIEYHDGTSWGPITTSSLAAGTSPQTYNWPSVDDNIGNTIKVRVKDKDNPNVNGESTADNIIKGSIDLTYPDGNNTLEVGQPWNIAWTKTGSIGDVKIEYSKDDFDQDLHTIAASYPSGDSPYTEAIPNDITNTNIVKVRLTSIGGIPVTDQSSNASKIVGKLTNINPNGGVVWKVGETDKIISWDGTGSVAYVDITYKTSAGGSYSGTIVNNAGPYVQGNCQYPWTAGVADEKSEGIYIKVADHANSNVKIESINPLSIRPIITVSAPASGQNIVVGSDDNTVTWNCNSGKVTKVDIYYSKTGVGGTYDNLINDGVTCVQGANSYADWDSVDDDISGDVVIKVRDKTDDVVNDNVYGLSPSFDIIGKITVNEPHLDENLSVGT